MVSTGCVDVTATVFGRRRVVELKVSSFIACISWYGDWVLLERRAIALKFDVEGEVLKDDIEYVLDKEGTEGARNLTFFVEDVTALGLSTVGDNFGEEF